MTNTKCTNCGATLRANADNTTATCPACKSSYPIKPVPSPAPTAFQSPAAGRPPATSVLFGSGGRGASPGEEVYTKNINAVVAFSVQKGNEEWTGSGFLVDASGGYIITNAHVTIGDNSGRVPDIITAEIAGEHVPCQVLCAGDMNVGYDIALVKLSRVPQNACASRLGDSEKINNGATVFVIGNSKGDGTRISAGIVGDKCRFWSGQQVPRILVDAAVNPGNSGGPMYNLLGDVIGIAVEKRPDAEAMGYAIPINYAKQFIRDAERKLGIKIKFKE